MNFEQKLSANSIQKSTVKRLGRSIKKPACDLSLSLVKKIHLSKQSCFFWLAVRQQQSIIQLTNTFLENR